MFQATKLSENGPTFSRIVSGVMTWGIWGKDYSTQDASKLIQQAIDLGITTFDHADIYGHYTTESLFGPILKTKPGLRKQMQLVTKCGIKLTTENRPSHKINSYDTSKQYILDAVDQSLRNLETDYIDLLLIHRPSPLMDPDEISEAIDSLKSAGKVLHFGVSNFTPSQMAMMASRHTVVTNQIEAHLLHLEPFLDGSLDYCIEHRIRPMIWSPLGGSRFFNQPTDPKVERIVKVAQEIGVRHGNKSLDQVLLAWLFRHPAGILPVLGTGRIERLAAAKEAFSIQLSREEWFELWSASTGESVP